MSVQIRYRQDVLRLSGPGGHAQGHLLGAEGDLILGTLGLAVVVTQGRTLDHIPDRGLLRDRALFRGRGRDPGLSLLRPRQKL